MYSLIRNIGYSSNITLVNNDSGATLALGRVTMTILEILKEAGIEPDTYSAAWNYEITEDTATKLSREAFKMGKPKRDQSKKAKVNTNGPEPEDILKSKPKVNLMDILLSDDDE